jgi:hypothetical protein
MTSKLKTVAIQTVIVFATLLIIGTLGIWFDLGPAVHSNWIAY